MSYSEDIKNRLKGHSFVIETYGCQMNRADSEIMETLLHECGMVSAEREKDADVIIMNTCSVREHAESRVRVFAWCYPDLESVSAVQES